MAEQKEAVAAARRLDLDWIRIGAFGLLILYHVGMFYVEGWDWHVKSRHTNEPLEVIMLATNPWRLGLLFLVSGAATRFLAARLSAGGLARSRTARLLPPLVLGVLVVVPPQSFYEVVEKLGYAGSYFDFYGRYLSADRGFCLDGECLVVPTYNHLWFVAYLWLYTLVLAALLACLPAAWLERLQRTLERPLSGLGVLVWPFALLAVYRLLLSPRFEVTHALVDDWYNHALSLSLFLFGFLFVRSERIWEALVRWRWLALAAAALSYGAYAAYYLAFNDGEPPHALRRLMRVNYALDQWMFIAGILGFGRLHLSIDGPVRRYLTDAIFPFYIVHQTAIVVLGHHLAGLGLPALLEAGLVLSGTMLTCVVTYEAVRRVGWLRPWFGLKRVAR